MGKLRRRKNRARRTKVTELVHKAPRQAKTAQETHQDDAPEFAGQVFLANFDENPGGDAVDFHTDLNDIDGQHIFQNVREGGLAYSAGFRTGDRLFQINGTNIEGCGIEYILDLLRTFHGYQVPQLMLAVERKPETGGGPSVFIWVIFKVVWQDGVPKVEVIQRQENDSEEMPFFAIGPAFSWLGPPVTAGDFYIDESPQLYLTIKKDRVVFMPTYNEYSTFHRYLYNGGSPQNGVVFACSLQPLKPGKKQLSGTPSGTDGNTVTVLDFPEFMLGGEIEANPRFWYMKIYQAGFSLESVVAKGMYLGMAENGEAMVSNEKTEIKVNLSTTKACKK